MGDNAKVLEDAKKKMNVLIQKSLIMGAKKIASQISNVIRETGTYHNVTGNTRGSIAWGIYYDGKLLTYDTPYDREFTKRRTLVGGEFDKNTKFRAPKDSKSYAHYYGFEASIEFLKSYYNPIAKGISIVFVVGTHYAEYLESKKGLIVMSDAYQFVKNSGTNLIGKNTFNSSSLAPFSPITYAPNELSF